MTGGRRPRLYLDHNATSPLRDSARSVMLGLGALGNPSSAHAEGRRARRVLEDARESIAECLGCARDEIVFTSGGTESNAHTLLAARGREVALPGIEHPSLLAPLEDSAQALWLPTDGDGSPREAAVSLLLDRAPALVSFSLANHETGSVPDLESLHAAARRVDALIHADASQAVGRVPARFDRHDLDLMTVSAHKFGGPVGIGALVVRQGVILAPLMRGGGQENGLRAGTEPAMLAAGFAAALEDALAAGPTCAERQRSLIARLRDEISGWDIPHRINTPAHSLPNTLNVSFPGRRGPALVHRLDLEGVAVSHGSACASGSLQPSPVLLALGCARNVAASALRISLCPDTDEAVIEDFLLRLYGVLMSVPARDSA